jgi:tetratricopeptide (TPR) repeat protein
MVAATASVSAISPAHCQVQDHTMRSAFILSAFWIILISSCAAAEKKDADEALCKDVHTKDWAINIAACTRVLARQPKLSATDLAWFHNQRGTGYQQVGEIDLSIEDFDRAIEQDPKGASLYNNRANSWRMKGDFERALADHEQAIQLDPNIWAYYNNRGITLREAGDLDGAIIDFGRAILLQGNVPNPLTERGLAWRAKGDLKKAIIDYDAAIRINPNTPKPYVGRGLAYEAEGDRERARADFRMAVSLPTHSVITVTNGSNLINVDEARYIDIAKTRFALLSATRTASSDLTSSNSKISEGHRVALVIGNGKYAHANALPNPPNDAHAVANTLRSIGFEVDERIDLDRARMDESIHNFLLKAVGTRLALLFYAGHSMQVDGHNYLVPIDASFTEADAISRSLTDLDTILAGLDDQIRANIVILDACRDNPLQNLPTGGNHSSRSIDVQLGLAAPPVLGKGAAFGAGTLLAFATAPGRLALDGDGINSPFSTALIRHLGTPGIEIQQMLTRVRADVVAATRGQQVPWSNSSLLGEIYLAGKS